MSEDLTPMMRQYKQVKKENPGTILMFRLGDFYEMFFEDAILAAKELEIALTGRSCGKGEKAPMCGVPFHAADSYIARLVGKGHKVAICEQMEDPALAKGIVKREVTRIVTPGTILDGDFLSGKSSNYIACVYICENSGITIADISTGEVMATKIDKKDSEVNIINELSRFLPVEILVSSKGKDLKVLQEYLIARSGAVSFSYDENEITENSRKNAIEQFKIREDIPEEILVSTTALLDYLFQTQKCPMEHLKKLDIYTSNEFLEMDMSTRRNLELVETMRDKSKKGSLYGVLDKTQTAMGSRLLKSWILRPLIKEGEIIQRLNGVEELTKKVVLRDEIKDALSRVQDLERLTSRISVGLANARDLASLRNSLFNLPSLSKALKNCTSTILAFQSAKLDTLEDIADYLERAIVSEPPVSLREGKIIKSGFNEEVDRLHDITENGSKFLSDMEQRERDKTGIKNLKVGYNKVFGYYIEVSASNLSKVPENYYRKQTLTNGERFITTELKDMESTVLGARDRLIALEYKLFCEARDFVCKRIDRIKETAHAVAVVDALLSFSEVALKNNYCKPEITGDDKITIKDGRHPVVETVLKDTLFVPNDLTIDKKNRTFIITGPNMAGKSTYMRQNALIVLMAQIGSFVPASSCSLCVTDKIFTRVGASDDLASGQSTFMLEMNEVAHILKNATKRSLCILDEIGRGTSTFDGLSIAWAVVEHINSKIQSKTLFATHYHELTALENTYDGIVNYNTVCKKRGDDITFLRKITRGGCDESYGIEVSKLAGVPDKIVNRAKEILSDIEGGKVKSEPVKRETEDNLFTMADHPIVEELKKVDVTTLTPIEALNKLYDLQKML